MNRASLTRFFLTIIIVCRPLIASASSVQIDLGRPAQTFEGWGMHPCDSDPTKENYSRFPEATQLMDALKVDMVKCIAKPECFNWRADGLDTAFVDASLVAQILALKKAGVPHYLLAIEGPPKPFKTYYSDEGLVDLHVNTLMEASENDYAHLCVQLIRYLFDHGAGLADGFLLQTTPNLKMQYGACLMPPDQLLRVSRLIRGLVDADPNLSALRIVGPGTFGYTAALPYLRVYHSAMPTPQSSFGPILVEPSSRTEDLKEFRDNVAQLSKGPPDLWITGWSPYQVTSEEEGVLRTVQELASDFNLAGASRWFWSQAYFDERSPRALVYGYGKRTPLYVLFSELIKNVPPGAQVLHVDLKQASAPAQTAVVAFLDHDETVVLIANTSSDALEIHLNKTPLNEPWEMSLLTPGDLEWQRKSSTNAGEIRIPVGNVCLLKGRL